MDAYLYAQITTHPFTHIHTVIQTITDTVLLIYTFNLITHTDMPLDVART